MRVGEVKSSGLARIEAMSFAIGGQAVPCYPILTVPVSGIITPGWFNAGLLRRFPSRCAEQTERGDRRPLKSRNCLGRVRKRPSLPWLCHQASAKRNSIFTSGSGADCHHADAFVTLPNQDPVACGHEAGRRKAGAGEAPSEHRASR